MFDVDETYARALQERSSRAAAQQAELTRTIAQLRVARSLTFADDEHDPDGSTVSLDHARDAALLSQTENTLAELNAAQQRLATGTYGICEGCGRRIPRERLLARPEARFCLLCSNSASSTGACG